MDYYTLLLACFAALMSPSLQFDDDRSSPFKVSRLARNFGKTRRGGAKIRGNLEITGPLGGRFEANLDGAIGRLGNLFNAETRGHLQAAFRKLGPLGSVRGAGAAVKGGFRRGTNGFGADVSGRLDRVRGNVFTGVHRNGVKGSLSGGAARDSFSVGDPFGRPFGNSYTAGLVGSALSRREYFY